MWPCGLLYVRQNTAEGVANEPQYVSSVLLVGGGLDPGTFPSRPGSASPTAVDYRGATQPDGEVHLLRQR